MDIVIIGSGNVAHCFSHLLMLNGHQIRQILSKNKQHAQQLAEKLNADFTSDFDHIYQDADIYIIAVSDNAIPEIVDNLNVENKLIAHTAGAIELNILKKASNNIGVLYPLQTLRKEDLGVKEIPLLIEGNSAAVVNQLKAVGNAISGNIIEMDSELRRKMHLAAIFSNNFPTHLATLCKSYCEQEKLDFKLLLPLLEETFIQMKKPLKDTLQTGPARRGDTLTIQKHEALLKNFPQIKTLYQAISQSIQKYYKS